MSNPCADIPLPDSFDDLSFEYLIPRKPPVKAVQITEENFDRVIEWLRSFGCRFARVPSFVGTKTKVLVDPYGAVLYPEVGNWVTQDGMNNVHTTTPLTIKTSYMRLSIE